MALLETSRDQFKFDVTVNIPLPNPKLPNLALPSFPALPTLPQFPPVLGMLADAAESLQAVLNKFAAKIPDASIRLTVQSAPNQLIQIGPIDIGMPRDE